MVTAFPNQPSDLTIQILERKSNRPVEDISPAVQSAEYYERFRQNGLGKVVIRSEDLSAESTDLILAGNASIKIIRDKVEVLSPCERTDTDIFTGPVTRATLQDGMFMQQTFDFNSSANEIIVLGNNTGASRNITRVSDTTSQASIGIREFIVDARQTTTSAERTARGQATLTEMKEFATQVTAGGKSTGQFTLILEFADNLV